MDPRYKLRCFDKTDHQKYRTWLEEEAESFIKSSLTRKEKEITRQDSGSIDSSITAEQSEFIAMLSQAQEFEKEFTQTPAPSLESDLKVCY